MSGGLPSASLLLAPGKSYKVRTYNTFTVRFFFLHLHHSHVFSSKQSLLFLQDTLWVYSAVGAVNDNGVVTKL